jgi:phenylalanine-4-hydroxylase
VQTQFIDQDYAAYSRENHGVWEELFNRRIGELKRQASSTYLKGLDALEIYADKIPSLDDINHRLGPITGWNSRAVPGYIPADEFFACLAERVFPTTTTIRPKEKLEYLPEPDIFHDVFGHIPMHANPIFGDFLQHFGRTGMEAKNEQQVTELQRLFWFTVEFGLIRENGELKIYGSGLVSSPGEGEHSLVNKEVDRREFNLGEIIAQDFDIDVYQPILFIIENYQQLFDAVDEYRARMS